jgi:hypothetical protein
MKLASQGEEMKKSESQNQSSGKKKLNLKRETVRTLTNDESAKVGGGNSGPSFGTSTHRSAQMNHQ